MDHVAQKLNELDTALATWRAAETAAKQAAEVSEEAKRTVLGLMHELGLKAHANPFGKVAIWTTEKVTWLVDTKERDLLLKSRGQYDRFCTSKLDAAKIKKYMDEEDDSFFGMAEKSTDYGVRFTPTKG